MPETERDQEIRERLARIAEARAVVDGAQEAIDQAITETTMGDLEIARLSGWDRTSIWRRRQRLAAGEV